MCVVYSYSKYVNYLPLPLRVQYDEVLSVRALLSCVFMYLWPHFWNVLRDDNLMGDASIA